MNAIKNFVTTWRSRGYEKGDTQKFWLMFLRDVLKVDKPENFVEFEVPVKLAHTNFIDAFFPDTKVIVEQKSLQKNIENLSAYQQAKKYISGLPLSMHPTKIIVCNFQEFLIYDMELMNEPTKILLEELPQRHEEFKFLIEQEKNSQVEISLLAGDITKKILKLLTDSYKSSSAENKLFANKLCIRFIFCLYADAAGIFKNSQFRNFLNPIDEKFSREALSKLFEVLSTPKEKRDEDLSDIFSNFPYVNGHLFDEKIKIPKITSDIKYYLFASPSDLPNFNWSKINPTIYGSVFETLFTSTNSEKTSADKKRQLEEEQTQREGGIHFTTVTNIHKVIDNLFLNDLYAEFDSCKKNPEKLLALQNKIANLKFFDPACGSGNFLTESYISLRRLENKILLELGDGDIKVSINQFFGIEINNFAVELAKLALWISELQMAKETADLLGKKINPLPLKNFANIFEGNALTLDWKNICPQPNFIFGNPPFVGKTFQTPQQKADIKHFFKNASVDYVACWYKKTFDFLNFCEPKITDKSISANQKFDKNNFCEPKIECAFVSTNSICQGEQVPEIFATAPIIINFAYRTFTWDSESNDMAAVHCVIIGFANFHRDKKIIFDGDKKIFAKNINYYLLDAENYFITKRQKTLQNFIPPMITGNRPADGGNLILSEQEKNFLIQKFPAAEKFIKNLIGAEEFLHNKKRFCLWLVDATPAEIKKIPPIYERIKKCREDRLHGANDRKKLADTPHLFRETFNPEKFIAVPVVSSELRKYIPMDFLDNNFICTDRLKIIPNANLFLFGVLESSVHMIFTKTFCGRLTSRINYSVSLIYNNFPFPDKNFEKISLTAEKILEVRRKYSDSTLAELYDENLMPKDLRDAHKKK